MHVQSLPGHASLLSLSLLGFDIDTLPPVTCFAALTALVALKLQLDRSPASKYTSARDARLTAVIKSAPSGLRELQLTLPDTSYAIGAFKDTLDAVFACAQLEKLVLDCGSAALVSAAFFKLACLELLPQLREVGVVGFPLCLIDHKLSASLAQRFASLDSISLEYNLSAAYLKCTHALFVGLSRSRRLVFSEALSSPSSSAFYSMLLLASPTRLETLVVNLAGDDPNLVATWSAFLLNGLSVNATLTSLTLRVHDSAESLGTLERRQLSQVLALALSANKTLSCLAVDACLFGLDWLIEIATFNGETSALRRISLSGGDMARPADFSLLLSEARRSPIVALVRGTLPLTRFATSMGGLEEAIDGDLLGALAKSRSLTEFIFLRVGSGEALTYDPLLPAFCRILKENRVLTRLVLASWNGDALQAIARTSAGSAIGRALGENRTLLEINGVPHPINVARNQRLLRAWATLSVAIACYRAHAGNRILAHSFVPLLEEIEALADVPIVPRAHCLPLSQLVSSRTFATLCVNGA